MCNNFRIGLEQILCCQRLSSKTLVDQNVAKASLLQVTLQWITRYSLGCDLTFADVLCAKCSAVLPTASEDYCLSYGSLSLMTPGSLHPLNLARVYAVFITHFLHVLWLLHFLYAGFVPHHRCRF